MIDQKTMANYFGDDDSLLRKFVAAFISQAPGLVNQMDEALASADFQNLARHAHTLKGQIRYFGYANIVSILQEIEALAESRQKDNRKLQSLLSDFNRAFKEAYDALSAIVN